MLFLLPDLLVLVPAVLVQVLEGVVPHLLAHAELVCKRGAAEMRNERKGGRKDAAAAFIISREYTSLWIAHDCPEVHGGSQATL